MKAKQPRVTGPTFEVGVIGTGLTVLAQGPSGDFGADEELVLSKVADGYRVSMNGEDAQARLVADSPCIGDGVQAVTSVICPVSVLSAFFGYEDLTSATQTAVTTGIDVRFLGGSGPDEFYASSGNDSLNGGPGDDVLFGDDEDGPYGNDTITGGLGEDKLRGFGGTNVVYAKDGIADKAVECADPDIAGSSGTATWDVGLDKPIQCGQADEVPDRPEDFKASVGQWKGTGDNATIDVTFTWKKPTASQPRVKSYDLVIARAATGTLTYYVNDGNATSKVVTFSAKEVPSNSYTAILTARNDVEASKPAVTTFSTAPKLNPARDVKATALSDRRQGINVTWLAPADSPAATLTGYKIQRLVPAELREGPEWRDMITLGPTSLRWADVCLPPNVAVTYRVTPMYEVPGSKAPAPGPSADASAFSPSFVERPPAPTASRVDFNGNFTINGRPVQVFLEATTTGPQVDVGECFGINYEYYSGSSFVGVDSQPRGTRGATATSYPALYLSGIQADRALSFRVNSAWVIDAEWRRSYGAGWNYEWVKDLAYLSVGNKSSASLNATGSVYTSTAGVSVSNVSVKRDAGTMLRRPVGSIDYRVAWTPPPSSNPNAANIRGYEVCSYSLINGVYSGLATNPKFPTYTTKMRCRVVSASTTTTTLEQAFWCPSLAVCAPQARNFFVQVRPWMGVQRPQSIGTSRTVWVDWNRNTFVTARPAS
jgi:hypothetical protein